MPVVLRFKGCRFFFYSNEGSPREPMHIHVRGGDGEAKIWLTPSVHVASSDGFAAKELRELCEHVSQNAALIEEAWNDYFG